MDALVYDVCVPGTHFGSDELIPRFTKIEFRIGTHHHSIITFVIFAISVCADSFMRELCFSCHQTCATKVCHDLLGSMSMHCTAACTAQPQILKVSWILRADIVCVPLEPIAYQDIFCVQEFVLRTVGLYRSDSSDRSEEIVLSMARCRELKRAA